jgi:(p)ppGpp synthase/HD superfamily hydrolase
MTLLTNRFENALVYCVQLHRNQQRKGKPVPYIAHLLSVSALVLEDGGSEDEAIAALLHDALEDQPDKTGREEIARRFGEQVLSLVNSCTDTPITYQGGVKPPWRQRKEAYLGHLRNGANGAMRVALADKLHNGRELVADYHREGEKIWTRFHAGKEDQLWYYQSLMLAFEEGGARGQLFDHFKQVVSEFERLCR